MEVYIFLREYLRQPVTYFILASQQGNLLTESAGYKTTKEFVDGTLQQWKWDGLILPNKLNVIWETHPYLKELLADFNLPSEQDSEPVAFKYGSVSDKDKKEIKEGYLEKGLILKDLKL